MVEVFVPCKLGIGKCSKRDFFFFFFGDLVYQHTTPHILFLSSILDILLPKIPFLGVQVERGSFVCFPLSLSPTACLISFPRSH